MTLRRVAGLLLLALAGCKSQSQRLVDALDSATSSAATVRAVAVGWAENRLPAR